MLTDEKHPMLFCVKQPSERMVFIAIFADQWGPLGVRLQVGEQFHSGDRIDVGASY